ncbi:DUF6197 family protein [Streptacidiphilus melanogenes]|uniref:DUF6197 family protein n=1 Tax=Streptacidiphilus melanogenes TaxID=411235 RepID=UPI0005A5F94A|nr:hypothetical protein [Streptacidiphilus melanogenes]
MTTRTARPLPLLLPDLSFVADGGTLVREVEAYLASLPAPARTFPVPPPNPYGTVAAAWDLGMVRPVPNWLDRIRHRTPAPTPTDTATHLRLVARYITAHGWTQGRLWDANGAVCLLGAQLMVLRAGYGTPDTASRARVLLMEQFVAQGAFRSVDDWNDRSGRRLVEVHRQLDIAAARAR